MAHGLAKALLSDHFTSYSAGIETHGLNPSAVKVMHELNIDISQHQSQNLKEFDTNEFDYVIAVCEHAANNCPTFPNKTKVITQQFDDPPKLAKLANSKEEALSYYRQVRDEIRAWIKTLPAQLN